MGKLKSMLGSISRAYSKTSSSKNSIECEDFVNSNECEDSTNSIECEDEPERMPLVDSSERNLKQNKVTLRVSMHCRACARKVEKRILKLEGVSSCKVDLDTKKVVIMGDIIPCEVLESVSKVKRAEFWDSDDDEE